jgi:hypothetical protein
VTPGASRASDRLRRWGRGYLPPATSVLLALSFLLLGWSGPPVTALASTAPSPNGAVVPVYGQQWNPWGPQDLGTSTSTISADGCALTASAMLLGAYGVNTNPGALNQWLIAHGGYVDQNLLLWGAAAQYAATQGIQVSYTGWEGYSATAIASSLAAGNPVIAQVTLDGNMHFVLITGSGPGGTLWINDPWYGDHTTFQSRYGSPATGIQSIRLYSGTPAAADQLSSMAAGSPATVSSPSGGLGADADGAALLLLPYTTPTSNWTQGTPVAVSSWTAQQISFTVPAGTEPGYVVVETSYGDPNFWFPFTPTGSAPVTATSISPQGGPAAGGTVVTITGSGFVVPSQVDFGTQPATSTQVVSPTEIQAVAPSGTGSQAVSVTDWLGTATAPTLYSYPVSGPPGALSPLPPSRICDTRSGNPSNLSGGAAQCDGHTLTQGAPLTVQVAGLGGVPASGANAAVLNVTVTDPTSAGYLTVYPAGAAAPLASNLDFTAGETVANLVEVGLGAQGQVEVVTNATSTDVTVDVEGYVAPPSVVGEGLYQPVATPTRICDTRAAAPANQCTGKTLGPQGTLTIQVTGLAGVPQGAVAVAANVTVADTTAPSYLTVYPGGARPTTSNLNWMPGATVPNLTVSALSPGGAITVFNHAGSTDVVVDVLGYYTPAGGSGAQFNPLSTPTRICDTRAAAPANQCTGKPLGPQGSLTIQVTGLAGVPQGAVAVAVNVTATDTSASSYLTVYAGGAIPLASSLNWSPGQTVPNLVLAALNSTGTLTVYNAQGVTDLVVDVEGWYS